MSSVDYLVKDKDLTNYKNFILRAETFRQESLANPSYLERRMAEILDRLGIKYEGQKVFFLYNTKGKPVQFYIVDFYLPGYDIIIEMDGKQHKENDQVRYDRLRDFRLQRKGNKVIRFTYEDMENGNCEQDIQGIIHEMSA